MSIQVAAPQRPADNLMSHNNEFVAKGMVTHYAMSDNAGDL